MTQPHPLPRVHVIRHGETEWSLSGRHTSRTDIPLTAHGEAQGRLLGKRLRGIKFSRVFTSPCVRARQTCELAGLAALAEIEPNLREWDYGDYESRTSPEIRAERAGWDLFIDGAPGGESPAEVFVRAENFVLRLHSMEGEIAVFSHGHFLRVLATVWIGLRIVNAQRFGLSTASLGILSYAHECRENPIISLWNETGVGVPL